MNFPRGINKIIEEYCCYLPPFQSELLKTTHKILYDTEVNQSYDRYYIDCNVCRKIISTNFFGVVKTQGNWKVYCKPRKPR